MANMSGGSSNDLSLRSVDSTKWNSVASFGSTTDSDLTNSFGSSTGALSASGQTSSLSLSFYGRLKKLLKRKSYAAERIPAAEERSRTTHAEIERSKVHWSDLDPASADTRTSRANWEAFEILKENPEWGTFFSYYDDPEVELELGEKIAEGGQAEIFLATERRRNKQEGGSSSSVVGVAKVFKVGFSLQVLQSQWPLGMLRDLGRGGSGFLAGGILWVRHGTMLNDGRFAFILERMWGDLRRVVDHKMQKSSGGPPFDYDTATLIMLEIAGGMLELHQRGVIHRDLKASNVLVDSGYGVDPRDETFECKIADFESSVGVVGTGFWRAPEILRAVRDGEVKLLDLFTQESDVYSYAMTCYEILTGGLPFHGHPRTDYDFVLNGGRPELPEWVTSELKELLERCWHSNPSCRPKFAEIMDTLQKL